MKENMFYFLDLKIIDIFTGSRDTPVVPHLLWLGTGVQTPTAPLLLYT